MDTTRRQFKTEKYYTTCTQPSSKTIHPSKQPILPLTRPLGTSRQGSGPRNNIRNCTPVLSTYLQGNSPSPSDPHHTSCSIPASSTPPLGTCTSLSLSSSPAPTPACFVYPLPVNDTRLIERCVPQNKLSSRPRNLTVLRSHSKLRPG